MPFIYNSMKETIRQTKKPISQHNKEVMIVEAFVMEVAGLATCVQPMFFSTREYCRLYLTQRQPEFLIEVTKEDLIYQQATLDREAEREGLRRRKFTDPFLERTVIQEKIAGKLLDRDTLLLHGSTVAVDGPI